MRQKIKSLWRFPGEGWSSRRSHYAEGDSRSSSAARAAGRSSGESYERRIIRNGRQRGRYYFVTAGNTGLIRGTSKAIFGQ